MATKKKSIDFEKSLEDLETLVSSLEKGELSLEESLKTFEKGIQLTQACQTALADAEQRVQILMSDNEGNVSLKTFDTE